MTIYEVNDACEHVCSTLKLRAKKVFPVMLHFASGDKTYGLHIKGHIALGDALDDMVQHTVEKGTTVRLDYFPEVGLVHPVLGTAKVGHTLATVQVGKLRKKISENQNSRGVTIAEDEDIANKARAVRDSGGRLDSAMRKAIARSVARHKALAEEFV